MGFLIILCHTYSSRILSSLEHEQFWVYIGDIVDLSKVNLRMEAMSNTCNINKIVSLEIWNYPAKTGQLLNIFLSHTLQSLGLLVYNERYGKFER